MLNALSHKKWSISVSLSHEHTEPAPRLTCQASRLLGLRNGCFEMMCGLLILKRRESFEVSFRRSSLNHID